MKTQNKRNHPKDFSRSNTVKLSILTSDSYSYGFCRKSTGEVCIGAKNLKGKNLDFVIDWLKRARRYQKFIKGGNK